MFMRDCIFHQWINGKDIILEIFMWTHWSLGDVTNVKSSIFKRMSKMYTSSISYETALMRMTENLTDD